MGIVGMGIVGIYFDQSENCLAYNKQVKITTGKNYHR
jgi:hypothetical protein